MKQIFIGVLIFITLFIGLWAVASKYNTVESSVGITTAMSYSYGPSTSINLPVIFLNAYGGWNSGVNIQNPTNGWLLVSANFYSVDGPWITSATWNVPPHKVYRFNPTEMGYSCNPPNPCKWILDGHTSAIFTAPSPISIVVNSTLYQ